MLTQKRYVEGGGNHCPACENGDIKGGFVEVLTGEAWQHITCNNCKASWHDIYTLTGYNNLKKGEEK